MIKDLEFLPTFPFHYKYLRNAVRGDYLNVYVTFDLTLRRLGESVFTTSLGLDTNMKHMSEVVNPPDFLTGAMANLSGQAADPFKIPPGTATQHDGGALMLDRLTRTQLAIFAIVTVLTVGAISIFYLHLPAAVGIGAYNVTANFVAGGGLYENANVTYRGVTVGRVESVGLTNDGVVAHMRLNSGTPVPDNVTATVKSVSAVGEQYIDLVPPEDPSVRDAAKRRDIGMDRTAIGQDISGLLNEADTSGHQRRRQPDTGPAARNVQGVQRIRTRAGPADPVVAAAGRRGQRELRAGLAADRPGGSVPGRADPQRRRHQVAVRGTGPAHR